MVKAILRQRFPSYLEDPLCAGATICLLAEDVRDIRELIAAICSSDSILEKDAREGLYRIAALFLHMERSYRFPYRLRYQLHHALYLSENAWNYDPSSVSVGEQKNDDSGPNFTAEQKRIIGYPLDPTNNGVIRVLAYAGTGKTTVLKYLAKKNPSLKFLLVAFNKSTQSDAELKFPNNVEARTAHSLAFKWCQINGYQGRVRNQTTYVNHVLEWGELKFRGEGFGNIYTRAALTLEALRKFAHSTRPHVLLDDVPKKWPSGHTAGAMDTVKPAVRQAAHEDAQILWEKGIVNKKSKFVIEGAFYIKLCQLANTDLHNLEGKGRGPFDVILIDEGQDMNPAMLDICLRQKGLKVIVGDPNQQIYEWNGAINGLEEVENYCPVLETLRLTESFRFGTEVAFVATTVMNCLLPKNRPQLLLSSDRVQDRLSYRGNPEVNPKKKMAILSRTNERMWSEIFAMICEPILRGEDERLKIMIKVGSMDLNRYLRELCELTLLKQKNKERISSNSKYKRQASFDDYKLSQQKVNNMQELIKCSIAEKHCDNMASYCDIIRKSVVHTDDENVDYIFSTVHQFKGLEYHTVMLLDDFLFDMDYYYSPRNTTAEDKRILYVALTRAQSELILNDTLVTLLYGSGRMNFERVTAVDESMIGKTCAHQICGRPLTEDQPIAIVYNSLAENYFCSMCSSCPYKRSLQDFTCGEHRVASLSMDNEWARLRQSMIGQVVTAENHEVLRIFYRVSPLIIVPKSVPMRRFPDILDDGNDDVFMGLEM